MEKGRIEFSDPTRSHYREEDLTALVEELAVAEADLARAEQSKLALADMYHVQRAREAQNTETLGEILIVIERWSDGQISTKAALYAVREILRPGLRPVRPTI